MKQDSKRILPTWMQKVAEKAAPLEKALPPPPPEQPRYYRDAFHNLYNYTLLGGGVAASVLTLNPLPALLALGVEGLWMALGTEIPAFKRLVEGRHEAKRAEYLAALTAARVESLPPELKRRYLELRGLRSEIMEMWQKNTSLARSLLSEQVGQLGALLAGFLDLAEGKAGLEIYLAKIDVGKLEGALLRQRKILEGTAEGARRDLLAQEIRVMEERVQRLKSLQQRVELAESQMSLMTHTFLLLRDELVMPGASADVRERLSDVLLSVGTARESLVMVGELEPT